MKMGIRKFAAYTGVSVRTLHDHDKIGLLRPAEVDKARLRYYDGRSILCMREILFGRFRKKYGKMMHSICLTRIVSGM